MEFWKKIQVLDGTTLKLLAMGSMLIDHIGMVLLPGHTWLRIVGRLAMPIFSFFVAEGFLHTRSRWRYCLRLGLFGLISEIPFDLAVMKKISLADQNIMFAFLLAVGAMWSYEWLREHAGRCGWILGLASAAVFVAAGKLLRVDYGWFGVGLVFLLYLLREQNRGLRCAGAAAYILFFRSRTIERYAALSAIPLLLYNGKRGADLRWLFYLFYPGHLLALVLLKQIL